MPHQVILMLNIDFFFRCAIMISKSIWGDQRMKIFTSVPSMNLYFEEAYIKAGNVPEITEAGVINVFDEIEYQSVIGFGGAFT